MHGDVRGRDFSIEEILKILHNEGCWWLQRPGGDELVGGLQRFAPLQGTKASIVAKDNRVKYCNKWISSGQGGDVLSHPQGHFVGDHVAAVRY